MHMIDIGGPLARFGAGFVEVLHVGFATTWRTLRVWARILNTRGGLAEMDDRMLADLGISRAQADFQLSRAPWELTQGR